MTQTNTNPITDTRELAIALSRLSKVVTGHRDSYLIQNASTLSLGTVVRHAEERGIELSLWLGMVNTAIGIYDKESMTRALGYMIAALSGSFIMHHDYIVWLAKIGIRNDNVVSMWKSGVSSPKMDIFFTILKELDGTLSLRVREGAAE